MTQLANYHKMIPVDDVVDLIDKAEKVELPANGKTDRTQCLNSLLDDLVGVYDATMRKYRSKKGDQYVPSKRGDFAESYANADEELSLDDSDYVPVAVAKADKDGLFFYIKTLHTVDVCAYKADPDNARAVSVHPLLFDMDANMDTKCKKAIDAVEHFEQVGSALIAGCDAPSTALKKWSTTSTATPGARTPDGTSGEDYCETIGSARHTNMALCEMSSCCKWDSSGQVGGPDDMGQCWSSIGQHDCQDTHVTAAASPDELTEGLPVPVRTTAGMTTDIASTSTTATATTTLTPSKPSGEPSGSQGGGQANTDGTANITAVTVTAGREDLVAAQLISQGYTAEQAKIAATMFHQDADAFGDDDGTPTTMAGVLMDMGIAERPAKAAVEKVEAIHRDQAALEETTCGGEPALVAEHGKVAAVLVSDVGLSKFEAASAAQQIEAIAHRARAIDKAEVSLSCKDVDSDGHVRIKGQIVPKSAFYDCKALKSVSFAKSITTIEEYAFNGCTSLREISFPPCLTTIGSSAFSLTALTKLDLSSTLVTRIGEVAFSGCRELTSVRFPTSLEVVASYAFQDNLLQALDFSGTAVTSIGERAFDRSHKLAEVIFPPSLETIGPYAFAHCTVLTAADLDQVWITSIGEAAFAFCPALAGLKLSAGLETIGPDAFANSNALECVDFGGPRTKFPITSAKPSCTENPPSVADATEADVKTPAAVQAKEAAVGLFCKDTELAAVVAAKGDVGGVSEACRHFLKDKNHLKDLLDHY
jgi:hypothetical protein